MLRITNISAGSAHSMVLIENGTVKCFGKHSVTTPSEISIPDKKIINISDGGNHFIILLEDGTIQSFDSNESEQAPQGKVTDKKIINIAAGAYHSMLLLEDNTLKFIGDDLNSGIRQREIEFINKKITDIAANGHSSCILLEDGTIRYWYENKMNKKSFLEEGKKITQIAVGGDHFVVLLNDNSVRCWGKNDNDQYPSSIIKFKYKKIINVYAGYDRTILLLDDGTIRCYGKIPADLNIPEISFLPRKIIKIAIGGIHSMALLDDGTVKCWGDNYYKQAPSEIIIRTGAPVKDNDEYRKDLASRITCPVCWTNEKKMRLSCGHMLCEVCSEKVIETTNECPLCRKEIEHSEIVYYKKYLKYKNKYLALRNN